MNEYHVKVYLGGNRMKKKGAASRRRYFNCNPDKVHPIITNFLRRRKTTNTHDNNPIYG